MLEIEGDIPFSRRSNLLMFVWLGGVCKCLKVSFETCFGPFSFKLRMLTECYMLFLVIIFICLLDEFQFSRCKQ